MGSEIAQLGVVHGFQVWLLDKDPQALSRSVDHIAASIRRLVSKRALSQAGGDDALRSLLCTLSLEELRTSDFVIKAIVESEDVKKKLFLDLDKIVKPSAVQASNTSSISITRLVSTRARPH
ncbi:hypothetical protein BT93_E2703 [Corymbia citriodora subsp. variegata]|nr:hypothetical protein BT93_E2703 [Corymbia citriodora subsp. variegata]